MAINAQKFALLLRLTVTWCPFELHLVASSRLGRRTPKRLGRRLSNPRRGLTGGGTYMSIVLNVKN